MSDDPERRGGGVIEIRERLARVEEAMSRIDRRVEELGPRWHKHDTMLTAISMDLSHVVASLGRVDRIQESVEAGFRVVEGKMEQNRVAASVEHASLRNELDDEIEPLKQLIYDHRAAAVAEEKRRDKSRPWHLAVLTSAVSLVVAVVSALVAIFKH